MIILYIFVDIKRQNELLYVTKAEFEANYAAIAKELGMPGLDDYDEDLKESEYEESDQFENGNDRNISMNISTNLSNNNTISSQGMLPTPSDSLMSGGSHNGHNIVEEEEEEENNINDDDERGRKYSLLKPNLNMNQLQDSK